jgi:CDP-archaeol synthase
MLTGLWVIAPVLGGYLAHAPVLRFDLLHQLTCPIDGGATLRGRRVFGDNKTWRGAVVMSAGVFAATLLLSLWPTCYRKWPANVRSHPVLFGLLLALGFVVGELPNSFIKRQFDIEPGGRRTSPFGIALSILDQADFVPVLWLTLSPLWLMSPVQALIVFAVVVIGHSMINVLGYSIGARKTWT